MTERVPSLLRDVGIPEEFLFRYLHKFSGGQRQRIGIARAIALDQHSLSAMGRFPRLMFRFRVRYAPVIDIFIFFRKK